MSILSVKGRGDEATRETRNEEEGRSIDLQTMSSTTMSPKEVESVDPVLVLGGRSWDLTNLCYPRGRVHRKDATISQQSSGAVKNISRCRPRRKTTPEASLYPNLNELDESLFDLDSVSEAFRKAAIRSNSPEPGSQPGAFHSMLGRDTLTRTSAPGAFRSSSIVSRPSKPPLPSWVEEIEAGELQHKLKDKSDVVGESSSSSLPSSYYPSRTAQRDVPYVDFYRQESMRSVQSTGSAYSNPVTRAEEEDESTTNNTRPRIEVAPGQYMPLRGSSETMAAVESGIARTVTCMACQATLRCVPDAELVVCPDCRLLSPLPAEKKGQATSTDWQGHSRRNQSFSESQPGAHSQIGGVGLGLKL